MVAFHFAVRGARLAARRASQEMVLAWPVNADPGGSIYKSSLMGFKHASRTVLEFFFWPALDFLNNMVILSTVILTRYTKLI